MNEEDPIDIQANLTTEAEVVEASYSYGKWQEFFNEVLSYPTVKIMITYLLKYITIVVFTYKFINSICDKSQKNKNEIQQELEVLQNEIVSVNREVTHSSEIFAAVSLQLNTHMDRFGSVRTRVREIIANSPKFQSFIEDIQSLEDNLMGRAKEDLFLAADILHRLNNDDTISAKASQPDKNLEEFLSLYNMSHSNTSIGASDHSGGDHGKYGLIKVINVYKVAYVKSSMRQKRLKRFQRQNTLKKQAEDIRNLLQEWQNNLSEAASRKLELPEFVSPVLSEVNTATESDTSITMESGDFCKADPKSDINWYNKSVEMGKYVNSIGDPAELEPKKLEEIQEETRSEAEELGD